MSVIPRSVLADIQWTTRATPAGGIIAQGQRQHMTALECMASVVSFVKLSHTDENTEPHLRIFSGSESHVSLDAKVLCETWASHWHIINDPNSIT